MKKPPSFWATFELTNFKLLRIFSEVTSLVLEILWLKSTIKPLSVLEKPKILVTVLTFDTANTVKKVIVEPILNSIFKNSLN